MEHLDDCSGCQKSYGRDVRRSWGCGWEHPNPSAQPWSPSSMDPQWNGDDSTCPGYTSSLPQVVEVLRARVHWEKNAAAFESYCGGAASDQTLAAIEILEGAVHEAQHWAMNNPQSSGGQS